MKKILLISFIAAAINGVSAINITGGSSGQVIGISSTSPFDESISGNITFTQTNSTIVLNNMDDELLVGTKVIIPVNGVLEIYNSFGGALLRILGDSSYQSEYTFTKNYAGLEQLLGPTVVVNATPILPPVKPTPTPAPLPGEIYIPRSRVNLDLVRNTKSTTLRNMENYKENGFDFNVEYVGALGGLYKDKGDVINYDSVSNGVIFTGTRNFGSITLGATFGYQDSDVEYKDYFKGTKENIDSYQLGISGRYNLTERTDMTMIITYGHGSHKFKVDTGPGLMQGAEYKSKIYDFDLRWGTKYGFSNGYIKPYLGLGVLIVDEKPIEKIGAGQALEDVEYSILGTYGEINLGRVDLFGNLEYTQRLGTRSYHAKRSYNNGLQTIEPLKYSKAEYNLGIGAKYRVNNFFSMTANYELDNFKNNVFKIGFGAEF